MAAAGQGCAPGSTLAPPLSPFVSPLLTDLYQITMAYAYWKSKTHDSKAVFDLFFRRNPFKGEYTIFAGLEDTLRFLANFKFTEEHITYIRSLLPPTAEDEFFTWLASIDCSGVKLYAMREGSVCFPRVPMMRVEGPLAIVQLLETTLLNITNYASLVATNAIRMRLAAGEGKTLLEFGIRRAQGPDGGMSASRYSYLGGFHGTSNVAAGLKYGIAVMGTHAHSFVSSFTSLSELKDTTICKQDGTSTEFVALVKKYREQMHASAQANEGELAAFTCYAQSFPNKFLALVDTYDTLQSGVPNFLIVALALNEIGYAATGIRLDSGDLAYLSTQCRRMFGEVETKFAVAGFAARCKIVASNDLNEATLLSLRAQGHEIDMFGIGTNLVTCQGDPALGGVYKLVEINGQPKIKLSEDIGKVTIPSRKEAFRLFGERDVPILDLMVREGVEAVPQAGVPLLCRHPFQESKRALVKAKRVEPLYRLYWDGTLREALPTLHESRDFAWNSITQLREDHIRALNPTPYKVSVSDNLYKFLHQLWQQEAPIIVLE